MTKTKFENKKKENKEDKQLWKSQKDFIVNIVIPNIFEDGYFNDDVVERVFEMGGFYFYLFGTNDFYKIISNDPGQSQNDFLKWVIQYRKIVKKYKFQAAHPALKVKYLSYFIYGILK